MNSRIVVSFFVLISLFSCTNQQVSIKAKDNTIKKSDTVQTTFVAREPSGKTVLNNGEHIEYYENGVIKMQGLMRDGHRDGLWKSWYEDGSPWSETTFKDGRKTGKTTTWFGNGKKRYEGFFIDDNEKGKWVYWDEKGNLVSTKVFP